MWKRLFSIGACVALTGAACGTTKKEEAGGPATATPVQVPEPAEPTHAVATSVSGQGGCVAKHESNLAGVQLRLSSGVCEFTLEEAAAGITFPYELLVDTAVERLVSPPADDGECGGKEVGGLQVREVISGDDHRFCECDVGHCMPPTPVERVLATGSHRSEFAWTGVSWYGESDTMTPYGDAFPPGNYTVSVVTSGYRMTSAGQVPFRISTTLDISLVD